MTTDVRAAVAAARAAQPQWAATPFDERVELLRRWAAAIEAARDRLTQQIIDAVGKPRRAADDEVRRAVAHINSAIGLVDTFGRARTLAPQVLVQHHPVGVVGLILPWNNPVALLVGKVAPALVFGNAAVVKPPPEASDVAVAVIELLEHAGAPPGIAPVVLGGRDAGEALCDDDDIDAIAVTGAISTGRAILARCAGSAKAVQAELGGNNAAIVLADADLDAVVPPLVHGAFGFAGQRCTAIRRFVVERSVAARFEALAAEATRAVIVGDPNDAQTEVGPLISAAAAERVRDVIDKAVADGARVVAQARIPDGLHGDAWVPPTLLGDVHEDSTVAQVETFGPVAVIIVVDDLDGAIAVANGVPHGLVMAIVSDDPVAQRRVLDEGEAGIIHVGAGPVPVHADAPFLGWKASGLGPPEHGEWDAAFYTRCQAVYGDAPC